MKTGRLDFKGKLNEDLTYRLRWRFDKDDQVVKNKTDSFSNQIDYAYVQHKLVDGLSLTVGKFASEIGSIEGNQQSSDIYLQSQAYRLISGKSFLYVAGAKITYALGNQEGSLYVINQSETTTSEQSKSAYGLVYKASLLEKTLFTNIGYLSDEKQSLVGTDSKVTTAITSAGAKWEPKPYFVSFDYITFTEKNVTAAGTNELWATMIIEAGYDFEGIMPKIKYEMTDRKTDTMTSVKEKIDGATLGVEYKPYPQDIFRYHLMVTQLNSKADGTDARYEIYADFMKN